VNEPRLILVADDEAHIRSVVCAKLQSAGYRTIEVADGEEALSVAKAQIPDLVITDLQMPYVTGLEFCHALRTNGPTASIPVIMLTARGYRLEPQDLAPTSIRRVMCKPFSARELLREVQGLLAAQSPTADPGLTRRDAA
jgi:CheY-like chemotaxis protein